MSDYVCLSRHSKAEAASIVRNDSMSAHRKLSDTQALALYNQHCMGESAKDLAQAYGISLTTVYEYIKERREKREGKGAGEVAFHEMIVAGNKKGGHLVSTPDPHRYEGTCVIRGKKHSRSFVTVNAAKATEMWEKWCDDLRAEDEFMRRVNREDVGRASAEPTDGDGKEARGLQGDQAEGGCPAAEEPVDVTPAPVPEIAVKPWRQVAEERQAEIDELRRQVEYLQGRVEGLEGASDNVIACTEQPEPKLRHWFNDNGSFFVAWKDKPIYVLWAKSESPRFFGVYERMDDALGKVDELNEVASFLGTAGTFEIEEVAWR